MILTVWVKNRKNKESLRTALIVVSVLVLFPSFGQVLFAETPELEPGTRDTPVSVPTGLVANAEAIAETPEPTATPGVVEQGVSKLATRAGLTTFLGLSVSDWINLGISILWVLIGYLLGTWLIKRLLPRAVRGSATEFDAGLLKASGSDIERVAQEERKEQLDPIITLLVRLGQAIAIVVGIS